MHDPFVGKSIKHRYTLQTLLGGGGSGKVYRALDTHLNLDVAVKIFQLHDLSDESIQRLNREAKSLVRFRGNPNIITIYDFDSIEAEQIWFIVTELIQGQTLSKLLEKRKETFFEVFVMIIHEVCSALEQPHSAKHVHRDIKPTNIMFDRNGRVVLLDFGLMKSVDPQEAITQTHKVLGTAGYLSPEQVVQTEQDTLSPASDIFSLGAILYQIFVGHNPFTYQIKTLFHALQKTVEAQFTPIQDHLPWVDPLITQIISYTLSQNAENRYPSATNLKANLSLWLKQQGISDIPLELSAYAKDPEAYRQHFSERLICQAHLLYQNPKTKASALLLFRRLADFPLTIAQIQSIRIENPKLNKDMESCLNQEENELTHIQKASSPLTFRLVFSILLMIGTLISMFVFFGYFQNKDDIAQFESLMRKFGIETQHIDTEPPIVTIQPNIPAPETQPLEGLDLQPTIAHPETKSSSDPDETLSTQQNLSDAKLSAPDQTILSKAQTSGETKSFEPSAKQPDATTKPDDPSLKPSDAFVKGSAPGVKSGGYPRVQLVSETYFPIAILVGDESYSISELSSSMKIPNTQGGKYFLKRSSFGKNRVRFVFQNRNMTSKERLVDFKPHRIEVINVDEFAIEND